MKLFFKHHTYHLIVFAALVIIAAGAWIVALSGVESRIENNESWKNQTDQSLVKNNENEFVISTKFTNELAAKPIINPQLNRDAGDHLNGDNPTIEQTTPLTQQGSEAQYSTLNIPYSGNPASSIIIFNILDKEYTTPFKNDSSVYNLMLLLSQKEGLTFKTKNYGENLGHFVTEINGKKNEDESGKYWIYSVNGKKATVGISHYFVQPNDIITWTYEENEI